MTKHDYEPRLGDDITDASAKLLALATDSGKPATMQFNDQVVTAHPGMTAAEVANTYHVESERRYAAYIASPEYAARMAAAEIAEQKRKVETAEALVGCPDKMSLRDPEGWAKTLAVNTDGYGSYGLRFAERWACMMEGAMNKGVSLADCAKRLSYLADSEGITGFMYGCAVSILAQVWEHGDALRRWHNLDSQIGNEGERANETGGTLNPALLTIG